MRMPDHGNSQAHPFEWTHIDAVAYRELLASPFFFARKVGWDGVSDTTAAAVFGAPVHTR